MPTTASYVDELQTKVAEGDVACGPIIAKILEDPAATSSDVFHAMCVKGAIDAMNGATQLDSSFMRLPLQEHAQDALRAYCAGCAALNLQHGTADSALAKFEEAVRKDPMMVHARCGIAVVYFKRKQYAKAFESFRVMVTVLGDQCPNIIRVGMGLCSLYSGQLDHAASCFLRALDIVPEDVLPKLCLYVVWMQQGRVTEASELMNQVYETLPTPAVMQRFADIAFFKSVHTDKVSQEAKVVLNLIECARSEVEKMIAASSGKGGSGSGSSLSTSPTLLSQMLAYSYYQQGRLMQALGKLDDAKKWLRESLTAARPPLLASSVHLLQIEYAQRVAKGIQPEEGHVALNGAVITKDVLQNLKSVHAQAPRDPELLKLAALFYSNAELLDDAVQSAHSLARAIAPTDPDAWNLAGWVGRLDGQSSMSALKQAEKYAANAEGLPDRTGRINLAALQSNSEHLKATLMDKFDIDVMDPALTRSTVLPLPAVPLVFNYALFTQESSTVRARELFIWIVTHHPHFAEPYFCLAEIAERYRKNVAEALQWLDIMEQANAAVKGPAAVEDASLIGMTGILHRADADITALEWTKSLQKKCIMIALVQGVLYLRRANVDTKNRLTLSNSAFNRFSYVIDEDPTNIVAAHGIACVMSLRKQLVDAVQLLQHVRELVVASPFTQTSVDEHCFMVLVQAGRTNQALTVYQSSAALKKAVTEDENSEVAFTLARCLAMNGQFQEAEKVLLNFMHLPKGVANLAFVLVASAARTVTESVELTDEQQAKVHNDIDRLKSMRDALISQYGESNEYTKKIAALIHDCDKLKIRQRAIGLCRRHVRLQQKEAMTNDALRAEYLEQQARQAAEQAQRSMEASIKKGQEEEIAQTLMIRNRELLEHFRNPTQPVPTVNELLRDLDGEGALDLTLGGGGEPVEGEFDVVAPAEGFNILDDTLAADPHDDDAKAAPWVAATQQVGATQLVDGSSQGGEDAAVVPPTAASMDAGDDDAVLLQPNDRKRPREAGPFDETMRV